MAYINESSEKSTNQSVTKLMQLFEYLSESRVPMRLQDIAAAIGVSQATTSRYLNALVDRKSTRLNSSHSGQSRMPSSA